MSFPMNQSNGGAGGAPFVPSSSEFTFQLPATLDHRPQVPATPYAFSTLDYPVKVGEGVPMALYSVAQPRTPLQVPGTFDHGATIGGMNFGRTTHPVSSGSYYHYANPTYPSTMNTIRYPYHYSAYNDRTMVQQQQQHGEWKSVQPHYPYGTTYGHGATHMMQLPDQSHTFALAPASAPPLHVEYPHNSSSANHTLQSIHGVSKIFDRRVEGTVPVNVQEQGARPAPASSAPSTASTPPSQLFPTNGSSGRYSGRTTPDVQPSVAVSGPSSEPTGPVTGRQESQLKRKADIAFAATSESTTSLEFLPGEDPLERVVLWLEAKIKELRERDAAAGQEGGPRVHHSATRDGGNHVRHFAWCPYCGKNSTRMDSIYRHVVLCPERSNGVVRYSTCGLSIGDLVNAYQDGKLIVDWESGRQTLAECRRLTVLIKKGRSTKDWAEVKQRKKQKVEVTSTHPANPIAGPSSASVPSSMPPPPSSYQPLVAFPSPSPPTPTLPLDVPPQGNVTLALNPSLDIFAVAPPSPSQHEGAASPSSSLFSLVVSPDSSPLVTPAQLPLSQAVPSDTQESALGSDDEWKDFADEFLATDIWSSDS